MDQLHKVSFCSYYYGCPRNRDKGRGAGFYVDRINRNDRKDRLNSNYKESNHPHFRDKSTDQLPQEPPCLPRLLTTNRGFDQSSHCAGANENVFPLDYELQLLLLPK